MKDRNDDWDWLKWRIFWFIPFFCMCPFVFINGTAIFGFDKERVSLFCENTLLALSILSCIVMTIVLFRFRKNPPEWFSDEQRQHFADTGYFILMLIGINFFYLFAGVAFFIPRILDYINGY